MHPRFIHLIIQNQLGDLSTHSTKYISPALTQKVFANMWREGKGCLGVETPLFKGMIAVREPKNQGNVEEQSDEEEQGTDNTAAEEPVPLLMMLQINPFYHPLHLLYHHNNLKIYHQHHRAEDAMKETEEVREYTANTQVEGRQADIYHIDMDHAAKVLSMQEDESEVQEVVEVVTTAKLITEVVADVSETVSAAAVIPSAVPETISVAVIPTVTALSIKVAAPVKAVVPSTRQKIGVVIRDPEEESSAKTPTETTSKDKGKSILVEEPKPMKKKQQVELDEVYARKLQEEFNQDIDWEAAIDHVKLDQEILEATPTTLDVYISTCLHTHTFSLCTLFGSLKRITYSQQKQRAKEEPFIQRYQVIKKRPQTEAQAQRNMMMYLKNTVGFTLDYFKGMSYDNIRLIFVAKFNANMEFLLKSKEQIEEEESGAIATINKTPAQKASKRRKLIEEAKEAESIKQHLQIVPDKDDDVFTEATPLVRKVLVLDYQVRMTLEGKKLGGQGLELKYMFHESYKEKQGRCGLICGQEMELRCFCAAYRLSVIVMEKMIMKGNEKNNETLIALTPILSVEDKRYEVVSSGWSFIFAVPGQMTYPVASLTLDNARSYVMQGAPFTQGTISSIPIGGNISLEGFLLPILLLVVIIVTVVIVAVILVVVVV
nr:hypothetical protein [Tanacetum cinerariifolium]